MHKYSAHGLIWASDIPLDGFTDCDSGETDVTVTRDVTDADKATDTQGQTRTAGPGRLMIAEAAGVRLFIENGNSIRYELFNRDATNALAALIAEKGAAAILLQRGSIPLQASCIRTKFGLVLLLSESVLNSSAILSGMTDVGCALVAKNVVSITPNEQGQPIAHPSPLSDLPDTHTGPQPIIGAIWLLAGSSEESVLTPLDVEERVAPLLAHVCGREYLVAKELEDSVHRQIESIGRHVPIVKYELPTADYPAEAFATHMLAAVGAW